MGRLTRRTFLNGSLSVIGAGFAIGGTKSSGRIIGANDTIRLGVAGLNGRGGEHIDQFAPMKGVQVVCLIDPDSRVFEKRVKQVEQKGGNTPRTVKDVRKALEDKDLDAISIATPNHWHSLMTFWACQAGKDVYVEKPCSHEVQEGQVIADAARKHDRIVQHGTQSRSESKWAQVAEIVKSGKLGKLLVSRGLCYKTRNTIGVKPNSVPPKEVDFDLWLGPATERAFNANLVHYNWHWFWDFGNGDIGNQGVHQMDIARWMIPGATLPRSVLALGGRFGYEDQGETPNTQIAFFDYGETQLIFEVRGLKTGNYRSQMSGNVLHFEEGTIAGNNLFYPKGSDASVPLPDLGIHAERGPGEGHFANFIAAVRSRKPSDLNAEVLEGHYSSALCHLANISYRLGESVPFNPQTRAFGDNKEAYETLARMEEHLTGDNGLKLDGQSYCLGRKLAVDASKQRFVNEPEADRMLTRTYRPPFVFSEGFAMFGD